VFSWQHRLDSRINPAEIASADRFTREAAMLTGMANLLFFAVVATVSARLDAGRSGRV
jgi:hypothetical protein